MRTVEVLFTVEKEVMFNVNTAGLHTVCQCIKMFIHTEKF